MTHARKSMEAEIDRLRHQRTRYLMAAHTAKDRHLALRHLLHVERLAEEIDAIANALVELDDHTSPRIELEHPTVPVDVSDLEQKAG